MITYLTVLYLSNMNIEDIAYREDSINFIDLKYDIDLACKKLNIKIPSPTADIRLTVDEAKRISNYINGKSDNG